MRASLFIGLTIQLAACAADEPVLSPGPAPVAGGYAETDAAPVREPSDALRARAEVQPVGDSGVEGRVDFTQIGGGVRVLAFVQGLDDGLFGFTIHEGSSCERPRGHFNPANTPHGDPALASHLRHSGDLGNIRSERSRARYDRIDKVLRLDSTHSIVGRVVAVHSGQDDLNSQPDGGSGDIVACGVIEAR